MAKQNQKMQQEMKWDKGIQKNEGTQWDEGRNGNGVTGHNIFHKCNMDKKSPYSLILLICQVCDQLCNTDQVPVLNAAKSKKTYIDLK